MARKAKQGKAASWAAGAARVVGLGRQSDRPCNMENRCPAARGTGTGIEEKLDEDRSQVRTGAAPQVLAGLRNMVISLVRRAQAQKPISAKLST